tara:strand:- start:235 stop:381 length:147 start_codon:yes stop_codon:yes gene_type:complete
MIKKIMEILFGSIKKRRSKSSTEKTSVEKENPKEGKGEDEAGGVLHDY